MAYYVIKKKYLYFEDRGVPFVKPSSLFLGNMGGVSTKIHFNDAISNIYDACKEKGVIAGFYTSIAPSFIVTDLELVKTILIKEFNNFTDRGVYYNEQTEPLSANLFAIEGEKWRFLRNKLSPTFTSGKIKSMYEAIADKGDNLVNAIDRVSKSGSIEVKDIANRFTTDIISSCAFGLEADTLGEKHPELTDMNRRIFSTEGPGQLWFFFLFAFPKLSRFLKLRQFSKSIEIFFMNIIRTSMEYREKNNIERKDFLNMLIQLKNKGSIDDEISTDSRKLTFNECAAEAFIFVSYSN